MFLKISYLIKITSNPKTNWTDAPLAKVWLYAKYTKLKSNIIRRPIKPFD